MPGNCDRSTIYNMSKMICLLNSVPFSFPTVTQEQICSIHNEYHNALPFGKKAPTLWKSYCNRELEYAINTSQYAYAWSFELEDWYINLISLWEGPDSYKIRFSLLLPHFLMASSTKVGLLLLTSPQLPLALICQPCDRHRHNEIRHGHLCIQNWFTSLFKQ